MIDLQKISLQFSGDYLFRDVNLKIFAGDKIALVGSNGTGKSSLLKIIFGELEPESGNINRQKRIRLGYLPQDLVAGDNGTLLHVVESSVVDIYELRKEEEEITETLAAGGLDDETRDDYIFRLGTIHNRLEELDSFSLRSKCERVLLGLGFCEQDFDRYLHEFSGGWQMRIALAKILIAEPDIILLDEPTNHLDIDSLRWLISWLKGFRGALILISHDRHFVNQVTTRTAEIFLKRVGLFRGNYDAYLKFKEERDAQLEAQAALQQRKIDDTKKFIERFRYKATKARQVQSRIKQLEKTELIELPDTEAEIHFRFNEAPQGGQTAIELNAITHRYQEAPVFSGIDLSVQRGERIAFVGPNGAGKTTMAKIIAGRLVPTDGKLTPGYNTTIAYYAQEVTETLNPEDDIFETIQDMADDRSVGQIRSLAGAFLFSGDDVFKKISVLSGGEKSRVALLKLMLSKANFLVLDEPTNHLDVASKRILQQALMQFSGTIVVVSHDVDFLAPLATKIIEFRGGGMRVYPGDIYYYLEKKEQEAAEAGAVSGRKNEVDKGIRGTDQVSRKEQKRLEAERRQQKHQLTRELKTVIQGVEKQISELELTVKKLETDLTLPEIYSDPLAAKKTHAEYNDAKLKLQELYARWEASSEELYEIEKKFEAE